MRLMSVVVVLSSTIAFAQPAWGQRDAWSERVEPFRVIGNIYYVGAEGLASYLVTTPEGHILLDTGVIEMHDVIRTNIEDLGFTLEDVTFMVSSHAHWDHIEGHAAMKRATGAQVVALGGDAVALESGLDNSALGAAGWEPVEVDRVVQDGDTLTLGGTTLRAVWTGGHTQGATMWMTTVQEDGRMFDVAFRGGEIPNAGAPLVDNPRHPTVVEDTQRTLRMFKEMEPPDLFLHNHRRDTYPELNPDLPVNANCESCLDAEGWTEMVASLEASFELRLTEP